MNLWVFRTMANALALLTVMMLAATTMAAAPREIDVGGEEGGGGSSGTGGSGAGGSTPEQVAVAYTLAGAAIEATEFWEGCGDAPGAIRLTMNPADMASLRSLPPPVILALQVGHGTMLSPTRATVRMELRNGAPVGVGPGQTRVEFVNMVSWAKEVWAWNSCQGRLAVLAQPGNSSIVLSMGLTRPATFGDPGPTTVVFSKPGKFGVWMDIAHFDPETFWGLADGMIVRFVWITE